MFHVLSITIAIAAQPVVSVTGVGAVPLSEATETCHSGIASASLLNAPSAERKIAFHSLVQALFATPADQRTTYFRGAEDPPWPATEVQANFVPQVALVQPGVVASCEAVGRYWLARSISLQETCPDDRSGCRAQLGEDASDILKEAFKAAKKASDPSDAFFAQLRNAELTQWQDPVPFLERACRAPVDLGDQGRFIDADSLTSARRSCLQLIGLAQGQAPTTLDLGCESPWADATLEAGHLDIPERSLGLATSADTVDAMARDQLTRMDPNPGNCGGAWASAWRKNLQPLWVEAQETQACEEAVLPLESRFELCPALPARVTQACAAGDPVECMTLAQMAQRGVGMSQDPIRAADMVRTACEMDHAPACDELQQLRPDLDSWLSVRVAALQAWVDTLESGPAGATPDLPPPLTPSAQTDPDDSKPKVGLAEEAEALLADCSEFVTSWAGTWGEEWTQTQATQLFDLAIQGGLSDSAQRIFDRYGSEMEPEWQAAATEALQALTPAP